MTKFKAYKPFLTFLYQVVKMLINGFIIYKICNALDASKSTYIALYVCVSCVIISDFIKMFITRFTVTDKYLMIRTYPYPYPLKPIKVNYENIIGLDEEKDDKSFEITKDITFTNEHTVCLIYKERMKHDTDITGNRLGNGKDVVDENGHCYKIKKFHFAIEDKQKFLELVQSKMKG